MISPTFTLSLIRELRGSPITVLVAMILLEQSGQIPITAQLLKDCTGYGDHTLTDSLRALTSPARQIVVRVSGGWRLASGFQLPLEIQSQNREKRGFEAVNVNNVVMVGTEQEKANNNINSTENREIRGFLNSIGIYEPKAGQLAALEWMTMEYVQTHAQAIKFEKWESPTGMLIHRLQNNHPTPQVNLNRIDPRDQAAKWTGHEVGCRCPDCSIIRSADGDTRIMCPDCRHYHCECGNAEN